MRQLGFITLLLASAAAGGCGGCSQSGPPAVASPAAPVPSGPMIDTLEYANWKKFPVGTVVKRRAVVTTEKNDSKVVSVTTFTLRASGEENVEVTRQNTTDRGTGAPVVNPAEVNKYVRQFALPTGMTADDFAKPSRGAKKTGEEELTVLGKTYKSTVYEWNDSTEAGPLNVKLWLSEDMPGRIVKQTMRQPTLTHTTVEEVVELRVP